MAASQQTSHSLASDVILDARDDLNEYTQVPFTDEYLLKKLNRGTKYIVAQSRCLEQKQQEVLVLNQLSYPIVKTGSHTGGTHATVLTAPASSFTADYLIGQTVRNITDKSEGIVTDNDANTVTVAALTGGTDNEWKLADTYSIGYSSIGIKTAVYNQGGGEQKGLIKGNLQSIGHGSQSGEPAYWDQSENNVIVYPRPNATAAGKDIDIYTVKMPAVILSTDTVLVPAVYDDALLHYIVGTALAKDKKYDSAGWYLAQCHGAIERYRADFAVLPKEPREIVK